MYKSIQAGGLAVFCLLGAAAYAQEGHVGGYVGGSIGEASVEVDEIDFDEGDTAFKIFGGYAFHPNFAVELAYVNAGEPTERAGSASLEVEPTGFIASGVGRIPLGEMFELFAKLGFAHYEIDATARVGSVTVFSDDDTETDLAYGIGMAISIGARFAIRAEYEMINIEDGDFSLLSAGGVFKF